jgi:hypothetical protein
MILTRIFIFRLKYNLYLLFYPPAKAGENPWERFYELPLASASGLKIGQIIGFSQNIGNKN